MNNNDCKYCDEPIKSYNKHRKSHKGCKEGFPYVAHSKGMLGFNRRNEIIKNKKK